MVATDLTANASDQGELPVLLDAVKETFAAQPETVLADAGYCNERDLTDLEKRGIDGYVAPGREGKQTATRDLKAHPATGRMVEKLATPAGRTEIPPAAEFSDLHHQATSVVQAVSHSQLHSAAVADVGRATEAGRVDQAAVDRVAAYEAPVETRAGSEEFSKADLAATYATLNRTTAIPAVYVPPAQTQEPENVERWAKTMEAPGGMSKVSQDITDIEQGFSDDRQETLRIARDVAREAAQQKQAEARQGPVPGVPVAAAPETPEPKPTRVGGDPELGAAPQRGGAGGAAATKAQTRTEDTPAKGKGKKKPGAPGDATR